MKSDRHSLPGLSLEGCVLYMIARRNNVKLFDIVRFLSDPCSKQS